jgi:formylglycine-generating enzyme required for sulfatase activity
MKTGNRAFSFWVFTAIAVIIICGLVFTSCSGGSDEASAPLNIAVTGVTLEGDAEFTLAVGQNKILDYTVLPEKATNKAVIWSSSDTEVAIASEGIVYAVGEGEATITVTTRSGYKTATCTVTVTPRIDVTGIDLEETFSLMVSTNKSLRYTLYPANATNDEVIWTSFNTGIASVSDGIVSGVSEGETIITATTADGGFEATCAVTVTQFIPEVDGMIWIPSGTFMMGSPFNEPLSYDNEILHSVTLTEGFYMGKYPVTQAEFEKVMKYNHSDFPDDYWDKYYLDRGDEYPVEGIMWYEAIIYCNFRSMDEGFNPVYLMYKSTAPGANGTPSGWTDIPANWSTNPEDWGDLPYNLDGTTRWNNVRVVAGSNGYQLPTEAQWEYACRAGTTTPFNTGDNITGPIMEGLEVVGGQANYNGKYPYNAPYDSKGANLQQTIPVGLFPPNAWGLYDMHGNVAEWCWDWYGSFNRDMTMVDPTGPATGVDRVIRGGGFWDDGDGLRSAYRSRYRPYNSYGVNGFRVVRPYNEPSESRSRPVNGTVKMMREGKIAPQRTRNFDKADRTSASPVSLQSLRRNAVTVE